MPTTNFPKRIGAEEILSAWGFPVAGKSASELYSHVEEIGYVWIGRAESWINPDLCTNCGSEDSFVIEQKVSLEVIGDTLPIVWQDRECSDCHHVWRVEYR